MARKRLVCLVINSLSLYWNVIWKEVLYIIKNTLAVRGCGIYQRSIVYHQKHSSSEGLWHLSTKYCISSKTLSKGLWHLSTKYCISSKTLWQCGAVSFINEVLYIIKHTPAQIVWHMHWPNTKHLGKVCWNKERISIGQIQKDQHGHSAAFINEVLYISGWLRGGGLLPCQHCLELLLEHDLCRRHYQANQQFLVATRNLCKYTPKMKTIVFNCTT